MTIRTNSGQSSQDELNPDRANKTTHLEFRILRLSEVPKIVNPNPTEIAEILTLVDLHSTYELPDSLLPSYQLPRDYKETTTSPEKRSPSWNPPSSEVKYHP